MDVNIVEQPELRIAGIRHIGPYAEIGREFGRLGGLLTGPPQAGSQMIAIFHDDPTATPPENLRSDAAITLPANTPAPAGLVEQSVPAGRFAKAVHKGGYEDLPAAWNAVREWAIENGHPRRALGYEIYLNNPMTTDKPELLTEIYLRVE